MRLRGSEQSDNSNHPRQQQQQSQQQQQTFLHHNQINNPETITIHCELHPDLDDPTSNWTEADPQSTIKAGSTIRGLDPFKHSAKRILEVWSRHQNHPDHDWELLTEGHSIDSEPLPPNETLRNLGIRDGDRFWVRSSSGNRSGSQSHGRQSSSSSSLPAPVPSRFEQERSLRPAPLSNNSPHVFPGPLDTSRALHAAMHAADASNSNNGGNTSNTQANSTSGTSAFALHPASADGNSSTSSSLTYPPPATINSFSSSSHPATSAYSQRDTSNYPPSHSNQQPSTSSQKHQRPDQDQGSSSSYPQNSYDDGSSKKRKSSPSDLNSTSPGFPSSSTSGRGGDSTNHGSFVVPGTSATFSRNSSTGSAPGSASAAVKSGSPAPNKTTAKIQRYESSISDLWGGDAWQNEVLMPSFAPVSKGKDAVRAVQQLAKLTPGQGGPGGMYPTRVKDAIVNAMQSRIRRNKLASQKTTIPDLQEAFAILKAQLQGPAEGETPNPETHLANSNTYPQDPQLEYQNPELQHPDYYNQHHQQGEHGHHSSASHQAHSMAVQHQDPNQQENYPDYDSETEQAQQS